MRWIIILALIILVGSINYFFGKPNQKNQLPKDIDNRIKTLFPETTDYFAVVTMLTAILNDRALNVGADQLIRSILIIAEDDKEKIKAIINSDFYGDPRDVIMEAMGKPGNTNDYGMTPFEE